MQLLDNPLIFLYIAMGILIFFLVLFKLLNILEDKLSKAKPKEAKKEEKKDVKKESPVAKEEVKEVPKDTLEDLPGDDKNNYLYDRFVLNPTPEDDIRIKSISDTFITDKDLQEIRERKTRIRVTPVQKVSCCCCMPERPVESENKTNKPASKILREFDGLSKEMKLLILENILDSMD